jgi:hypothetical protein
VQVEVLPGVVTVVAAWMLDPWACAGMEIGAPRASLEALQDLEDLLKRRGFRRSCSGGVARQRGAARCRIHRQRSRHPDNC